jgi:hypothetical protein
MGAGSNYASAARREAEHILASPPFTTRRLPEPLGSVLRPIGHAVDDAIGKPIGWLWHHLHWALFSTFGSYTDVVVALFAVVAGGLFAWLVVRRRTRIGPHGSSRPLVGPASETPEELDAAADAAETDGNLDEALRLRFRAGLFRLEDLGVIASRFVTTTDDVKRRLASPSFDRLADSHETVAYAGRHAGRSDVSIARDTWPCVLAEAAERRPHDGR